MAKKMTKKEMQINLAMGALLTAIVVVFQLLGSFIKFGPFSISLVLVPIIVGAAVCGPKISTWLGFVFGVIVLFMDAGAFLAISVPGTIVTVLLKGTLCGLCAGLMYKLVSKKNQYLGIVLSAIVCPIVNTGIFLLGCFVFFFDTMKEWGAGSGYDNPVAYMILGLVGVNFLVEMATNIVLCPVILRIINIKRR